MPLSTAAHCARDPQMVLLLLEAGADPNQPYTNGGIVLGSVCHKTFIGSAKHMIDFGADINHAGGSVIHWAIISENVQLLRYMLDRDNVDLDRACPKHYDRMPLHTAVLKNNEEMVRMLVQAGACIDVRDGDGSRPVDLIDEERGDFERMRQLLAGYRWSVVPEVE